MENKYLEKIARMTSPVKAAILMGGLGSGLGYIGKKDPNTGKAYTSKERLINSATLGTLFGVTGGLHVHAKNLQEGAWKDYAEQFTRKHYGKYGGTHAAHVIPLSSHFKEMGMSRVPKTKAEVHKFYKSQAMKHHPDRPTGNAKKMEEINAAYTKIKSHPEFEKLACLNKYINKLNDIY